MNTPESSESERSLEFITSTVLQAVRILARLAPGQSVDEDTNLSDVIDSTEMLELFSAIEEALDVKDIFDIEDYRQEVIGTPRKMAAHIYKKLTE